MTEPAATPEPILDAERVPVGGFAPGTGTPGGRDQAADIPASHDPAADIPASHDPAADISGGRELAAGAEAGAGEGRLVGADRVLAVLAELARHPAGIGLDDMARAMASPKPTVHRALAALRRAGFAAHDGHGRYLLGDEYLRLAFAHHEARPDHVRVLPILTALSERYGETCHYAVLDGPSVVYRSKLDPPAGAVRLSSVVGGRNPAHCTAVGKVLLAALLRTEREVLDWVGDRRLETPTERSLGTAAQLHAELATVREHGYGVDDQETDPGVVCLAVPAYLTSPSMPSGAISISSLAYRTPLARLVKDLPAIRAIVAAGGAGPPGNGPPGNRPPGNRPAGNRPPDNRPAGNRPADNRPADNGPADNGPADNGPADNGPTTDETTTNGTARNGPPRNGTTREEPR